MDEELTTRSFAEAEPLEPNLLTIQRKDGWRWRDVFIFRDMEAQRLSTRYRMRAKGPTVWPIPPAWALVIWSVVAGFVLGAWYGSSL